MNRRTFLQQSTGALAGASIVPALAPAARASAQTTRTLSMAFTGDVILTRRISSLTDPAFLKVRALLSGADCTFGNCELVIADRHEGVPSAAGASLSSVVRSHIADEIRWLGFDAMGTANNHTLDYGVGGGSATLRHLNRVGIVAAGTGVNLQEAAAPRYVESAGGRIAVIGCASTVAPLRPAVLERGDYPGVLGTNTMRIVKKWQLPKAQLDAVKAAADALLPVQLTGAAFPVPPGVTFMGNAFVEGPTADVISEPHPKDLKRITDAVAIARPNARADRVDPRARDLSRPHHAGSVRADDGAGVHRRRRGRVRPCTAVTTWPAWRSTRCSIFYGLGDFFFQHHTFEALGADSA
ncbi:MAG: CapA family protein [Vicinamibacterales bacterium]